MSPLPQSYLAALAQEMVRECEPKTLGPYCSNRIRPFANDNLNTTSASFSEPTVASGSHGYPPEGTSGLRGINGHNYSLRMGSNGDTSFDLNDPFGAGAA